MAVEHVTRRVHFYKLDAGVRHGEPIPVDIEAVLDDVQSLQGDARYMDYNDLELLAWVDRVHPPQQVRLAAIRRRDLPMVERGGDVRALDLAEEEGIADSIHAVFFPNRIVGSDFNFRGPRVTALSRYLQVKSDNCPAIVFRRLLRTDFQETLDRLPFIRLLDLRVHHSYVPTLQEIDETLGAAFRNANELGDMDELEVILRPKKYERGWNLGQRVIEIVRQLMQRDDLEHGVTALKIQTGDDGRSVEFDLLKEHLVYEEEMIKLGERTRAVEAASAFSAIRRAYAAHADELQGAATV